MTFQPIFVPGGVYLRTSTGELIGQLDNPGAPFASLDEAQEHADWLEMVVEFQQVRREFGLVSDVPCIAAEVVDSGTERSAASREKQLVSQDFQKEKVGYE